MADESDILRRYYGDPETFKDPILRYSGDPWALAPEAPQAPKAELREYNPDPLHQAYKGAAEGLYGVARTPYDVGQAGAETYLKGRQGDYAGAAKSALPLLPVPGAKRVPTRPASLMQRLEAVPTQPTRGVLPSELPFSRDENLWRVHPPDPTQGYLSAEVRPAEKAVHIGASEIASDLRGQGMGVAMYQRLMDEAHKHGLTVHSDNAVSGDAQKIYESLAQRGYQVQRNPRAIADDKGNLRVLPGAIENGRTVARPSEPVFTVHPPEPSVANPLVPATTARNTADSYNWKSGVEDPAFRRLMGQEYAKAKAGDDYSTMYDILGARLYRDKMMPPQMRQAMELELEHIKHVLGPEWMAKYGQ